MASASSYCGANVILFAGMVATAMLLEHCPSRWRRGCTVGVAKESNNWADWFRVHLSHEDQMNLLRPREGKEMVSAYRIQMIDRRVPCSLDLLSNLFPKFILLLFENLFYLQFISGPNELTAQAERRSGEKGRWRIGKKDFSTPQLFANKNTIPHTLTYVNKFGRFNHIYGDIAPVSE